MKYTKILTSLIIGAVATATLTGCNTNVFAPEVPNNMGTYDSQKHITFKKPIVAENMNQYFLAIKASQLAFTDCVKYYFYQYNNKISIPHIKREVNYDGNLGFNIDTATSYFYSKQYGSGHVSADIYENFSLITKTVGSKTYFLGLTYFSQGHLIQKTGGQTYTASGFGEVLGAFLGTHATSVVSSLYSKMTYGVTSNFENNFHSYFNNYLSRKITVNRNQRNKILESKSLLKSVKSSYYNRSYINSVFYDVIPYNW